MFNNFVEPCKKRHEFFTAHITLMNINSTIERSIDKIVCRSCGSSLEFSDAGLPQIRICDTRLIGG